MKRLTLVAAVSAAALTLTACGTTEPAAGGGDSKKTADRITLTDASGKKVSLDGPAEKVVATEWNIVENLISLGVEPAGVSDVKGYKAWAAAVPLKNEPKDIGTRGEPSMDSIAALAPDLIITTTDMPDPAVKQLSKVAKVLEIRPADAAAPVERMMGNLDLIAQATGTAEKSAKLREGFEAKVAEGREALADAGLAGARFAFADGYVTSNQVSIRPYTSGSLIGAVNEQIGLKNAWTLKGDKEYGLASTDVEGLTKLGDTHFAYIGVEADANSIPFSGPLAKNAVWKSLPFVKKGNVHRLADGIWMFGGPGSMEAYIDAVVGALTK